MNQTSSIVLADDHPIVRQGIRRMIDMDESFQVLGEAGNGSDALRAIRKHCPDIAVFDISMPGMSGLDIAKVLRDEAIPTRVVVLTMHRDREFFDEAMALNIQGYILKDSAPTDLLDCLRTIRDDGHYISPTLSGYLLKPKAKPATSQPKSRLEQLTQTEKAVLKLIAESKTSKEIADKLFISYRTVQNHRFNMCRKLNLKGHHKLMHFALEHRDLF